MRLEFKEIELDQFKEKLEEDYEEISDLESTISGLEKRKTEEKIKGNERMVKQLSGKIDQINRLKSMEREVEEMQEAIKSEAVEAGTVRGERDSYDHSQSYEPPQKRFKPENI